MIPFFGSGSVCMLRVPRLCQQPCSSRGESTADTAVAHKLTQYPFFRVGVRLLFVALIIGVHCHSHVAQHGFRPRGCHDNMIHAHLLRGPAFTGKWVEVSGRPSDFGWGVKITTIDNRTLKTGSVFGVDTVKLVRDTCGNRGPSTTPAVASR